MRLHSLRLRAFGPFATEQHIDFEPLGAGGLFLLDGPTGAGKSTVLDAITFALYGPGEGGGWGRLHSHFAEPGVEPSVTLEFSLRGVRQRVTRSPAYPRPKRRGSGAVLERASVHLERRDGDRWVSRSARHDEVGDMLADDLGLTRDQFTQVVLLPQGEFARFLRANDDERRTLLTKLFGTQLYDRITDELDRRRKAVSGDLDQSESRLWARVAAAAAAAGFDAEAQDALAALPASGRDARLADLHAELSERAGLRAAESDRAGVDLEAARQATRSSEQAAERMRRYLDASRRLAAHVAGRETYEQAAAVLAAADRAEPVRPLLEALDDADRTLTDLLAALPPGADTATAQHWSERASSARTAADELRHVVDLEQTLPERERAVATAREALHRADKRAELLSSRALAVPDELDTARAARAEAAALADGLAIAEERVATLGAAHAAAAALATLDRQRIDAVQARDAARQAFLDAAEHHLALAEARLANMAAELAGGLHDGDACPVCGSLEHPDRAVAGADPVTADLVGAALAGRSRAERARDDAVALLNALDVRRAGLAERAADDNAEALATARVRVADAQAAGDRLPDLDATLARLGREATELAESQRTAAAAVATCTATLEGAVRELADLTATVTAARGDHATAAARRGALLAEAAGAATAARTIAEVDAARERRDSAHARALAEAADIGFDDLDTAAAAVQPAARRATLRELVNRWDAELAAARDAAGSAEFEGLAGDDADEVFAAADRSVIALRAAEARAGEAALVARRAADTAAAFASARAAVAEAAAEHDRLREQAGPVVHLAKLARGVAGQRRVNLTTYVLRQWFEQVVAAANVRLGGMSSGRYELVRVDEGAARAERTGLTVQVLDRHTGEMRNARSLSGGETFYTSLALALGLADVVRAEAGGVDLDTLFIDEGFGSLDADTLDQVMAVIDELRDRGRTVGIVSHVSELKNRIAERIEVRRLPDGSSTLRVVA